jgi:repressor LexA
MKGFTKAQKQVYDFMQGYQALHGVAPSRRKVCAELGYKSPNAAQCHVDALIKKGYMKRGENRCMIFCAENVG